MGFRDNLQHLRSTRNMTQEQLAMLLGVSRQSVSKWEAEKAYPEMDKLLKVCEIFDCTLDELVQGDLTDRAADPQFEIDQVSAPDDVCGYDEVMRRTAHRIAAGIGVILVGVGAAGFLDDAPDIFSSLSHDAGPALAMFGGIAAGLALILPATFERSAFSKEHPFVEDFYTADERIAAKRRMGAFIAGGVALIMLGLALGASFEYQGLSAIGFFTPLGAGVALIVDAAMVSGRMDVEAYNNSALGELGDAELDALDDPDLARRARKRRQEGYVYGAIMLGATIIALLWLFVGTTISEQSTAVTVFWLPWPIGGLICALVACIKRARS